MSSLAAAPHLQSTGYLAVRYETSRLPFGKESCFSHQVHRPHYEGVALSNFDLMILRLYLAYVLSSSLRINTGFESGSIMSRSWCEKKGDWSFIDNINGLGISC
jgi:hypothetical protein